MTAVKQLNSALAGRYSIEREIGATRLRLAATPQPSGGLRWWIRCPTCGVLGTRLEAALGRF